MKKFIKPSTGTGFFKTLILTLICACAGNLLKAQTKPSIAVPDFDTRGYAINNAEALQYVINELIRVGQFEVMDKYDIEFLARRDTLSIVGCFSKICLQ